MSGALQLLCRLLFHPLLGCGRRRVCFSGDGTGNWAGLHRPGLCPGRAGGVLPRSRAALPLAYVVPGLAGAASGPAFLGAASIPLDGLRPLLGAVIRVDGPVNKAFRLPTHLVKGRRAGLLHLIRRLDVGRRLLPGPFLFHQLLAELGGHLAADVPRRPSVAFAFSLDFIAGVPFPWFWHGSHLRFASHGEIYFSTWFSASAIPAIM